MSQITKPKPQPLGRGLSALFGDADASYAPNTLQQAPATGPRPAASQLPIEQLSPGAFQPRRHFSEPELKELSESIKARGILQPLLVRPLPGQKDSYEIIAGERRWRAAQLAGLHQVPAVVRELTDTEALEVAIIENVQRMDLSPLEEAEGYKRLIDEFRHTQEDLAKIVGKSRSHIANLMRLLTLPQPVKQMLEQGLISAGHARALVTAKNPFELASEIVKKGLNVRQAEDLARQAPGGTSQKKKATPARMVDANVAALEKELGKLIGLKLEILVKSSSSGAVTIHYQTLEQLDGIIKKLRG